MNSIFKWASNLNLKQNFFTKQRVISELYPPVYTNAYGFLLLSHVDIRPKSQVYHFFKPRTHTYTPIHLKLILCYMKVDHIEMVAMANLVLIRTPSLIWSNYHLHMGPLYLATRQRMFIAIRTACTEKSLYNLSIDTDSLYNLSTDAKYVSFEGVDINTTVVKLEWIFCITAVV